MLHVVTPGVGSCHRTLEELGVPTHLPVVAYSSCSSLGVATMKELIAFFKDAANAALAPFRGGLLRALEDPAAPEADR